MSLYAFMNLEKYEVKSIGVPHYSGLELLALEVLLKERWDLK
jgi:hypothetical protein